MANLIAIDGRFVNLTAQQLDTVEVLENCRKGGIATVHKYESGITDKKCLKTGIANINFISMFSYLNRLAKIQAFLPTMSIDDIDIKDDKLLALSDDKQAELFDTAIDEMQASNQKTIDNDRNDTYRQGHDECYVTTTGGVKLHLNTEKVDNRMKAIVDSFGNVSVASIMIPILELNKTVIRHAEFKPTNSRVKTLMKKAIEKVINDKFLHYKHLSLKDSNFSHLSIDKNAILPESV